MNNINNILYSFLESILFIVLMLICAGILIVPISYFLDIGFASIVYNPNPYIMTFVNYIPTNIAYVSSLLLIKKFFFKRKISELGLLVSPNSLLVGIVISISILLLSCIILILSDNLTFKGFTFNSFTFWGCFIMFFFQSLSEEIFSKSFFLSMLTHRFGNSTGLIISSLIFMLPHISNPNFTYIGGATLFVFGIFTGLLFLYFKSIWVCVGFHWFWNFFQGIILDFNVSGTNWYSIIRFETHGINYISGGKFGIEGSIVTLLMLIIYSVIIIKYKNNWQNHFKK